MPFSWMCAIVQGHNFRPHFDHQFGKSVLIALTELDFDVGEPRIPPERIYIEIHHLRRPGERAINSLLRDENSSLHPQAYAEIPLLRGKGRRIRHGHVLVKKNNRKTRRHISTQKATNM